MSAPDHHRQRSEPAVNAARFAMSATNAMLAVTVAIYMHHHGSRSVGCGPCTLRTRPPPVGSHPIVRRSTRSRGRARQVGEQRLVDAPAQRRVRRSTSPCRRARRAAHRLRPAHSTSAPPLRSGGSSDELPAPPVGTYSLGILPDCVEFSTLNPLKRVVRFSQRDLPPCGAWH